MIRLLKRAVPAAPPASRGRVYYDSADNRLKFIDENGLTWSLSADGLRDQNLAINGGFDYARRQVPGTLTTYSQTAARGFGADRFAVTNENTSVQYRRVDTTGTQQTGLQARYYGEYSKITSTGKIVVSQTVEAGNCQHLRGRKVRLQMKLKASASKNIRLALLQLANAGTVDVIPGYASGAPSGTFVSAFGANTVDPTFGTNLAKINPDTADGATITNTGLSCSVTTAWTRFGGTFTLPTDFKNLAIAVFTDSQFAAADNFGISEVGLYDGTEIREWSERMQIAQYENCLYYFWKTFAVDVAPAQSAGNTGAWKWNIGKAVATALAVNGHLRYTIPMRISPALTLFSPGATSAQVRRISGAAAADQTATATANASADAVDITATGDASGAVGDMAAVHITADAEL